MFEDLKMVSIEELSELLNTSIPSVNLLKELGIIKATKVGRRYMFSQYSIRAFQRDYEGLDVSNRVKAIESMKIVQARKEKQNEYKRKKK